MKKELAVSAGKKRMSMVSPSGKNYEEEGSPAEERNESDAEANAEGDDRTEAEANTGDQSGVSEEAQAIVDSIGDNHALCMGVYELLKEKYADEKKADKGEVEGGKAGGDSYSDEGMPQD